MERASLAQIEVEAVVRPIRSDLDPVSAASRDLWMAAGPAAHGHLDRLGSLPIGGAVITPAGELASSFVIHAVVMSEDEAQTSMSVQRAVQNSLRRAADWGLTSLALPPLGLGAGLTEPEDAARALVELLANHLDEGLPPDDLALVVSSDFDEQLFRRLVDEVRAEQE